jgi:Uma2 family endonuclease
MASSSPRGRCSYEDFLAYEDFANTKHEFLDGVVFGMPNGSPEHGAIAMNIAGALVAQLRGRGCRVQSSDVRIRVLATGLATYPDLSVVCGQAELDPLSRVTITNPVLVVEVMSPGTAEYDRTEKLEHYKQIPSLREVILVAHDEHAVTIWRRSDGDSWTSERVTTGAITLSSVPCTMLVDDVYRDELIRS